MYTNKSNETHLVSFLYYHYTPLYSPTCFGPISVIIRQKTDKSDV